jgi:hypothetical protein
MALAVAIATTAVAIPPRAASAQAPSSTPWPVVTAAILPPVITPARRESGTGATAVLLAPIAEDPADDDAVARRSPWAYLVAGILGAIGAGMYGWSAWRRLREPS